MDTDNTLHSRNKLLVNIIWGMLILGIAVDFLTGAPPSAIITLTAVGVFACAAATVLTYKRWLESYVMYLVSAIVAVLTVLLIMTGPVVTTYFLVYVNLAIMTLYGSFRAIVFSALLGAALTAYVYLGPYRNDMFPNDSPITVLLYLGMVAAPLLASARFSEKLQRTAREEREQAVGEKNRTQAIVENVAGSLQVLNRFSEDLKQNVTAAGNISREVTAATLEITSGSQQLAASIAEVDRASRAIGEAVEGLASRSAEMRELSAASALRAAAGSEEVRRLKEQMDRLEEKIGRSVRLMEQLDEQSQKIGEIVAAIKNISAQTNLLALNAAIEAARAGEHGAGFGVVSGEIRKLAETSQQAAEEIENILEGIREKTSEAAREVHNGRDAARFSREAADRVAEALESLNADAEKVQAQASEVDRSADGLREQYAIVGGRIAEIAEITEKNLASMEQMSAAMQTQDRRIREIVHSFLQLDKLATDLSRMTEKA